MKPETLKRAVELADGWGWLQDEPDDPVQIQTTDPQGDGIVQLCWFGECWKDALAAQLVRQVDQRGLEVWTCSNETEITDMQDIVILIKGDDRTENTINAIIESGVLDDV